MRFKNADCNKVWAAGKAKNTDSLKVWWGWNPKMFTLPRTSKEKKRKSTEIIEVQRISRYD